jgi:hypothetical protein
MTDRVDLEIDPYVLTDLPIAMDEEDVVWLYEEFRMLQKTVEHLVEAAPQATNKEPDLPRRGTIRFNLDPWNPLGDGLEGYCMYDGSAWVAINARA